MPDGDIIDRKVLRGWRTPMRMLVGVAPSAEVSTAAVKALVRSLKENGGMPALAELHEILELRLANRVDAHSAFTRIEALERAYGHTRHAKLAAKAAKRLMIESVPGRRALSSLREALSERFCHDLLDHHFFDRIGPELGKHFHGWPQAEARRIECKQALEPLVRRIARDLAQAPEGAHLKTPPEARPSRMTTEDILSQSIM